MTVLGWIFASAGCYALVVGFVIVLCQAAARADAVETQSAIEREVGRTIDAILANELARESE